MVAEEGQNADAEHGRHKKKKQDMEFGVSAVQLILERRQGGEKRCQQQIRFTATRGEEEQREEGTGSLHAHRDAVKRPWMEGGVTFGQFSADFLRQSFSANRNETG